MCDIQSIPTVSNNNGIIGVLRCAQCSFIKRSANEPCTLSQYKLEETEPKLPSEHFDAVALAKVQSLRITQKMEIRNTKLKHEEIKTKKGKGECSEELSTFYVTGEGILATATSQDGITWVSNRIVEDLWRLSVK
jgi:hypothetical protein